VAVISAFLAACGIRSLSSNLQSDKEAQAAEDVLAKKLLDKKASLSDAARAAVTPVKNVITIEAVE
jgi:hypothetical protein